MPEILTCYRIVRSSNGKFYSNAAGRSGKCRPLPVGEWLKAANRPERVGKVGFGLYRTRLSAINALIRFRDGRQHKIIKVLARGVRTHPKHPRVMVEADEMYIPRPDEQ